MKFDHFKLSIAGLVILALTAGILSLAALGVGMQAPVTTITPRPSNMPTISEDPTTSASDPASRQPTKPAETVVPRPSTPAETVASTSHRAVLVIGDRYSLAGTPESWVDAAADELGWKVINFAGRQRGYLSDATDCDVEPCSNFTGTVDAIADRKPDMVITFGGTADGDQDLSEAATAYFEDLRAALPDAELVAVAPITTGDEWPYYLTMHARSIRAAVEAVDGTFIDSKRIGLGDGEELSEESQRELAKVIIEALR